MDLTALAIGAIILVGLVGIVVPVLPGLLLVWAGVGIWALEQQSTTGWVVLAVSTILYAAGLVVEFAVPGRRMRRAGVRTRTLLAGLALAIVGFFVIPVVGALLGFPLGVYLAERAHRGGHESAWTATKHALRAVGLNILIELLTGFAIVTTWVVGLIAVA